MLRDASSRVYVVLAILEHDLPKFAATEEPHHVDGQATPTLTRQTYIISSTMIHVIKTRRLGFLLSTS
jgi:hypothetical protein